jgi:mitochondrial import receptor subunit TOM40
MDQLIFFLWRFDFHAQTMMHGMVDSDGALQGRVSYPIADGLVGKANVQINPTQHQSMLQAELDYTGADFTANLKAVNPSPVDGTGILVASYLQSITKSLAVGAEAVLQRPMPGMEDSALSFAARYTFPRYKLDCLPSLGPHDPVPEQPIADPVLTATVQAPGAVHLSYVHPISSKVELASELQVVASPRGREGVASIAAKYDFRQSTFRTQLDTNGKIASVLEQKMGPIAFLLAGEIDHAKGASRFGFGVTIETM